MLHRDGLGRRRPRPGAWLLGLAAVATVAALWPAAGTATAQAGATAVDPVTGELPNFTRLFMFSPVINGIIAGLSVIALGLFLFFLLTINTMGMAPPSFINGVTRMVINKEHQEATRFCRNHSHIFAASVVLRCVENAGKQHSVIMDMLDTEGRRRADILWNRISYLADVANLGPMLGLLGTVRGMIKAFFSLQRESGSIDSMALSVSIGEAMATTMFGLALAIVATIFHTIVRSRVTRSLATVEQVVHNITDHIKREETEDAA